MGNNRLRMLIIALVLCMMLGTTIRADTRESSYIAGWGIGIHRISSTTVKVDFSITGKGYMSQIGATKVEFYRSDGVKVATYHYTDTGYAYLMTTNDYHHSGDIQYTGVVGESYYAIVSFYAGNSTGYDTHNQATTSA